MSTQKSDRTIDFLAVGPQRTGSTWLYEALLQHPDIAWPRGVKETFFFDQRFKKGMDWYYWHFQDSDTKTAWGEVGPTYFDDLDAAQRIKDHVPDCKIIVSVRNPIEKTYSVFRHFYTSGLVPPDFEAAVEKMPRIIDCGHYRRHCQRWEELFGSERVYYLVQDDIKSHPQASLDQVCQFLELNPIAIEAEQKSKVNAAAAPISPRLVWLLELLAGAFRSMHLHSVVNFGKAIGMKKLYRGGAAPPSLTPQQTETLRVRFEPDIKWLEQRLDRSFQHWTA